MQKGYKLESDLREFTKFCLGTVQCKRVSLSEQDNVIPDLNMRMMRVVKKVETFSSHCHHQIKQKVA